MRTPVFERRGHTIDEAGCVQYDDRPITWARADEVAGRRLDRRRRYAIIDGEICQIVKYSYACSGCYEGYEGHSSRGFGCGECGHTGRRAHAEWVPCVFVEAD